MSSDRCRDCGKQAFRSRYHAAAQLKRMRRRAKRSRSGRTFRGMTPYECTSGLWHLGHHHAGPVVFDDGRKYRGKGHK